MEANSIKTVKTKYFEIIYPEESSISASLLFYNADKIYEEVATSYGWVPHVNLPLVICPTVQHYKSYFDGLPYKHMVMYDTAEPKDYAVFSNDFLSKFRHEISLVFIRTMWDKFWSFWGFDLGFLWITPGIEKGPSILSESYNGEGLLNDEYFKHIVKQSVIENKFPKFSDVQGPKDVYPQDTYLPFNTLFTKYLIEKYGQEKYKQFFFKLVNSRTISVRLAFFNVYKLKLNEEWLAFSKTLEYKTEKNPARELENDNITKRYYSLQKSDLGIYYIDVMSKSVFFVPFITISEKNKNEQKKLDISKTSKLFTMEGICEISVSNDGKFIAVGYDSNLQASGKKSVDIFNTETKKWFGMKESGLYETAIFMDKEKYKLVCKLYKNQQYTSQIYDFILDEKNQNIIEIESRVRIDHPYCIYPSNYSAGEDGTFVCTLRENMKYSICIADSDGNLIKKYNAPLEKMCIRQLNYSDGKICFSWTQKDSMPRFGYFDTKSTEFMLDNSDYSGGIFFPVMLQENSYVYTGYFYAKNLLFEQNIRNLKTIKAQKPLPAGKNELVADVFKNEVKVLNENSKKYIGADFYRRFLFIPFSFASSETHLTEYDVTYYNPFGISLFASSPWTDGKFNIFAGYGITTNSFIVQAQYKGGTDTEVFKYEAKSSNEFDLRGWKQTEAKLIIDSYLPLTHGHSFEIKGESQIIYGRKTAFVTLFEKDIKNQKDPDQKIFQWIIPGQAQSLDNRNYLYHHDQLFLTYAFIKRTGNGHYKKAGFSFCTSFYYVLNQRTPQDFEVTRNCFEQGFELAFYLPGFAKNAPLSNILTYDLPIKFIFSLFPFNYDRAFGNQISINNIKNKFSENQLIFSGYAELILFAMEVQKAIPVIQVLYLDNFKISLTGYEFIYDSFMSVKTYHLAFIKDYCTGILQSTDCFYGGIRFELGLSTNFGGLSGKFRGNCFGEIIFGIYNANDILYNIGLEMKI